MILLSRVVLTAIPYRKKVQEKCRKKVKLLHFSCTFFLRVGAKKVQEKCRKKVKLLHFSSFTFFLRVGAKKVQEKFGKKVSAAALLNIRILDAQAD